MTTPKSRHLARDMASLTWELLFRTTSPIPMHHPSPHLSHHLRLRSIRKSARVPGSWSGSGSGRGSVTRAALYHVSARRCEPQVLVGKKVERDRVDAGGGPRIVERVKPSGLAERRMSKDLEEENERLLDVGTGHSSSSVDGGMRDGSGPGPGLRLGDEGSDEGSRSIEDDWANAHREAFSSYGHRLPTRIDTDRVQRHTGNDPRVQQDPNHRQRVKTSWFKSPFSRPQILHRSNVLVTRTEESDHTHHHEVKGLTAVNTHDDYGEPDGEGAGIGIGIGIGRDREKEREAREGLLMRCTVLDHEGNVKTISGAFRKLELCSAHGIQQRDLRKIDSRIPNTVPTIFVRKESILVNILHIRAIIKADSVVLFDSFGSSNSTLHSNFLKNLETKLRPVGRRESGGMPYEFRALDSMLSSVTTALESEMSNLRKLVGHLLESLEQNIERDKLKLLLQYSRKLAAFAQRVKLVQGCLEEVLEQDEDLAAMYLTEKNVHRRPRQSDDHEEVEILLESFSKQVEEIVSEVESLLANVKSTEEIVELILDSNRNALLALDLKVSIATMGIGSGALVAGCFGMNLQSHLETHPNAFLFVSAGALCFSLAIMAVGLDRVKRIRKIGLGSSPGHGGGGGGGGLPRGQIWRRIRRKGYESDEH